MLRKNKNLQKFYNSVYDRGEEKYFTNLVLTGNVSEETTEVLKEINWKGKKILDVGCGTGYFAFCAAKKGAIVHGIDYSENAISIAKTRYKHKNLKFEVMDINKISGKYDAVISLGTLEHMDDPVLTLKLFKNVLSSKGKIIITSPNWTNPRGLVLITLWSLFDAPITLADLHYQTPIDFKNYANKLKMKLKWRTIDHSWGNGTIMIDDLKKRLPNVLRDAKLPKNKKNISRLIDWLQKNIVPLDNQLLHSGATGLYIFSK